MAVESRVECLARLEYTANQIRQAVMTTLHAAGGGHVGASLSAADILTALYFDVLRLDPSNPAWEDRDRFVLSKGHACAALCPVLAEAGFFPADKLSTFNQLDSPFGVHPDMLKIPGTDMSTGALGHGLAVGLGMALGARIHGKSYRTFVLLGDGELCEGSVWESAMAAAHYHADNLTAIVDRNKLMLDGPTEQVLGLEPLAEKWWAFGWEVREIDGHDLGALVDTLSSVPFERGKPSVVIAETVKGKGLPFAEGRQDWHYHDVDREVLERALAVLRREPGERGGQ